MADAVQIPDEAEVRARWGSFAFTPAVMEKAQTIIAPTHRIDPMTVQTTSFRGVLNVFSPTLSMKVGLPVMSE